MDIKNVKLMIRRNLGDYEHEELSLDAEVTNGDDPQEVINNLRAIINSNLSPRNINLMSDTEKEKALESFNKAASKATKVKAKKEAQPSKADLAKVSKVKKKSTPLDPTKELHKKLFGQAMTEVVPNWRKKEILQKKAGKIMKKLTGEDLISPEGEILESFIDMVRAEFK